MASLLLDFWQFLKQHRKALRRAVLAVAVLVVVVAAIFVRISESPRFCYACHIMRPYYRAWEESSHKEVNCLECHYPPTIAGHVKSKFVAISQVVQYFTGSYGTRFWAEIDDDACLREGCHDTRLLSGAVTFKENIAFDHAFHLGEMRRGKRLRCTSCHSQMVIGTHIDVTESVCFACHFKDAVLGKGTADCLICHGPPGKSVTYKGVTFDHAAYVERDVPCVKCHMHVVEGDGRVPETRCYSCHGDRSNMVSDPVLLHRTHVTDHKVECFECHLEIRHGALELSPLLAPECSTCHGDRHSVQEGVYVGTGGLDTPSVASAMFDGQVSCSGCHTAPGHAGAAGFPRATRGSCVSCHGVAFGQVYDSWTTETRKSHEKAKSMVAAAKAVVYATGSSDPARAHARTLIAQAEKNLELVAEDGSWGAHNVIYANALIETAVTKAAGAAKAAGRKIPYAPATFRVPAEEDTCAWRCHFGVERRSMTVRGKTFDHGRHLSRGGIECASCHDLERHGLTLPTAYNCSGCHHARGDVDCSSCHGDVSGLAVSYKGRPFDHGAHGARPETTCLTCHPAESPSVVRADCSSCHHKDEAKNCASCHATQAKMLAGFGAARGKGKPSPMAKLGCKACHGQPPVRPGAASCTKCHPAGYANIFKVWGNTSQENYRKLSIEVKEARGRRAALEGVTVDGRSGAAIYEEAAADLKWAGADGSWGAHNNAYVNEILKKDADELERVLAEIAE